MILLTGSTGFLGREVLDVLLRESPHNQILLLVRSKARKSAERRCLEVLEWLGHKPTLPSHISIVEADICKPNLGLSKDDYGSLAQRVTSILHCAASTDFELDQKIAAGINVEGTKQLLSLALCAQKANPNFSRFTHVSTAYLAGSQTGIVPPDTLPSSASRNTYETTKTLAEQVIRGKQSELPITIVRPSIIAGHSRLGRAASFQGFYIICRLILQGLLPTLPADPQAPLDIVPVDYVASALAHLHRSKYSLGRSFHLSSGVERETCSEEVIQHCLKTHHAEVSAVRREMPRFSDPRECMQDLSSKQMSLAVAQRILPFTVYMQENARFDMWPTYAVLKETKEEKHALLPPLFSAYAHTIFRYALESNWGRTHPVLESDSTALAL